ncbi:carbohydrate ABC transporter permease [Spirochaetia bacterium 38H-sp]|uniref:sn-glycerol-3-phosphate transport system permease protein UgpE n=1 Tax=Rarispira pelagica TaxID=3141764 RepID=A0ABU9UAD5_9SPIR
MRALNVLPSLGRFVNKKRVVVSFFYYSALVVYAFFVLIPILYMLFSSFKPESEIFSKSFGLPKNWTLGNYERLFSRSHYGLYFFNSILSALVSLFLIAVFSSTAAYVLAKYKFKLSGYVYAYFLIGLIFPLQLGTIVLLKMMLSIGAYDSLIALILVNVARGIPLGIFILTDFIRMIPEELSNAARIDGASESGIFVRIILPLIRPALASVLLVNLIPVWNDFWFPLVFIKSDFIKTIPLATALLFGQFETNYGFVVTVLAVASLPVMVFYLIASKSFVKSITGGALKG